MDGYFACTVGNVSEEIYRKERYEKEKNQSVKQTVCLEQKYLAQRAESGLQNMRKLEISKNMVGVLCLKNGFDILNEKCGDS